MAVSAGCLIAFLTVPAALGDQQETAPPIQSSVPDKTINTVLAENTDTLMALPGVVAVAQGECDGEPCIKVYVTKRTRDLLERIPDSIEGFSVIVEESGDIRAL
jgi:hypothetical protein